MLNVAEPDEDGAAEEHAVTGVTTRELDCSLNDTEVRERGEAMAAAESEAGRLKVRRRGLNVQIRGLTDKMTELAKVIESRIETREVQCEWRPDYKRKVNELVRTDTGKVIDQKQMTSADLQGRLPGIDQAEAREREDAEDAAADALEDEDEDEEPSFHEYAADDDSDGVIELDSFREPPRATLSGSVQAPAAPTVPARKSAKKAANKPKGKPGSNGKQRKR